jgi:hypothetical protein
MVFDWNYRLGVDKDGKSYGSFDGSIGGGMAGGDFDDGKIRTIWLVIVVSVAVIVEYTKD